MRLVMLPGMDGTGRLFEPFIRLLPDNIDAIVISYPEHTCLGYESLERYVVERLPKDDDFVLLAESFSGPLGYLVARNALPNLKAVVFVATFVQNQNRWLTYISGLIAWLAGFATRSPEWLIRKLFFSANTSEDIIRVFLDIVRGMDKKVLACRIKEVASFSPRIERLHQRVFYLQPSNDKLVSADCVDVFRRAFDDVIVLKVQGPHFILQNNPEDCIEIIFQHIGR